MSSAPPNFVIADVLIVGGGTAGLTLALRLADRAKIAILAKQALTEGSSLYAQGGIAAVLNETEDSLESHVVDTMEAGAGLCHRDAVEYVVQRGPAAVGWLIDQGVVFSREPSAGGLGGYHLTREGGDRKSTRLNS